jgi:uncharacterized protein
VSSLALEALLVLQELDTTVDQRIHRRATLPEHAEMAAIDARLVDLRSQLGSVTSAKDEVAAVEDGLQRDLDGAEARIAEVSKRLYGGGVSASRELQAMAADIESLRARAAHLEESVFEQMEAREPLDARIAELETEIEAAVAERAAAAVRLTEGEARLDVEIAELQEQRAGRMAIIPPDLLATYEKLRQRLDGVGAARLVGVRCTGCHLSIPATELDRMRHYPDELAFCDQCGRILVA